MNNLILTLSKVLYAWAVDPRTDDYTYFMMGNGSVGHGYLYIISLLLVVPLVFTLYFYYVQAKNLSNATKKDYLIIFFLGFLTLFVLDFVLMSTLAGHPNSFSSGNLWIIQVLNVVYYSVMYQTWSWLIKGGSNAKHIDLISCILNK